MWEQKEGSGGRSKRKVGSAEGVLGSWWDVKILANSRMFVFFGGWFTGIGIPFLLKMQKIISWVVGLCGRSINEVKLEEEVVWMKEVTFRAKGCSSRFILFFFEIEVCPLFLQCLAGGSLLLGEIS